MVISTLEKTEKGWEGFLKIVGSTVFECETAIKFNMRVSWVA